MDLVNRFCGIFIYRVLMQIVQELCKRPGLNRTGFDMPTIYIPNTSKCPNQIEEVCSTIEKTIEQTVQNALNNLGKDASILKEKLESQLNADTGARSRNFYKTTQSRSIFIIRFCFVAINKF